ncbi:MAG: hypothetical protein IKW64_02695 [Clostridia bacterium]|nr:hypothetical protein [Clostridia bacterium]
MLLVTNTGALSARFGDKKAIEMFAAAGFDALDCSLTNEKSLLLNDGFREYAAKLRKFAEDNGIFFVQAHAPMPYANEFSEFFSKRKYQTITAMESASILGATVIIVHPLQWGRIKTLNQMFMILT